MNNLHAHTLLVALFAAVMLALGVVVYLSRFGTP
jgi:hypothetical protein